MPKVVRVQAAGGPEVLKIEELPLPQPGQGELRLKVHAIGLNRAEVLFLMGMYMEPLNPPSRIGYDAVGVVDAVGPGVTNVKVGERVATVPNFAMGKYGVYGEYALVPAHSVAAYPDVLSSREAAAVWMSYLTVYGAFMLTARIGKGDYVGRQRQLGLHRYPVLQARGRHLHRHHARTREKAGSAQCGQRSRGGD